MTRSSSRSKARKRALDILFESELRDVDTITTLEERTAAGDPPVREYTAVLVRGAVYEIDYGQVPDAVAISEAVQLVSELSTDESPSFVNGVLRAVATSRVG